MGVSPARATNNNKLLERPLPVDGNLPNLPSKRTSYRNNKYLKAYENNNFENNNNIKNIISNPSSKLTIYLQNVRGLGNKLGEFEAHVLPLLPQIICLTEHHLSNQEIGNISINQYQLGAFHCRSSRKVGGVNILV
jgi:hypothetical protein